MRTRRRVYAITAIVFYMVSVSSHAKPILQKESLRGLKGVAVTVKVTPKAERVGLAENQIRAGVEQQLRSAGVPLLARPRDILLEGGRRVNNFPPSLNVLVDVTPRGAKAPTYVIEIALTQDAADTQNQRAKTSVVTWRTRKSGTYSRRSPKEVRREIELAVGQFINDYEAANME